MLNARLTDPTHLQALLQKAGIQLDPRKSQHFLVSDEVLEATLELAGAGPRRVTELGAGIGTLTQPLAAAGFAVRAIERDPALAALLERSLPPKNRQTVEIIQADLRETAWEWTEAYQLIGNIPYAVSGLIIRRLTELDPTPLQAILLVQKEVGERLTAHPPDMSLLSLAVGLWGSAEVVVGVPKSCFLPEPQVDSALVYLKPHSPALYTSKQRQAILDTARIFFGTKRKQMGGVLKKQFSSPAGTLESVGLTPEGRPQELSVEQWAALTEKLS